jgi:hypothetical protein
MSIEQLIGITKNQKKLQGSEKIRDTHKVAFIHQVQAYAVEKFRDIRWKYIATIQKRIVKSKFCSKRASDAESLLPTSKLELVRGLVLLIPASSVSRALQTRCITASTLRLSLLARKIILWEVI